MVHKLISAELPRHDHSFIACSRHIYVWGYSSRTSRSWWITQSTQHYRTGCNKMNVKRSSLENYIFFHINIPKKFFPNFSRQENDQKFFHTFQDSIVTLNSFLFKLIYNNKDWWCIEKRENSFPINNCDWLHATIFVAYNYEK